LAKLAEIRKMAKTDKDRSLIKLIPNKGKLVPSKGRCVVDNLFHCLETFVETHLVSLILVLPRKCPAPNPEEYCQFFWVAFKQEEAPIRCKRRPPALHLPLTEMGSAKTFKDGTTLMDRNTTAPAIWRMTPASLPPIMKMMGTPPTRPAVSVETANKMVRLLLLLPP
jgi:hypothetical protein